MIDLSIVMPCLNEARTIGACIEEAKGFIKSAGLNAEIIVVDNNSTDDSAKNDYHNRIVSDFACFCFTGYFAYKTTVFLTC